MFRLFTIHRQQAENIQLAPSHPALLISLAVRHLQRRSAASSALREPGERPLGLAVKHRVQLGFSFKWKKNPNERLRFSKAFWDSWISWSTEVPTAFISLDFALDCANLNLRGFREAEGEKI